MSEKIYENIRKENKEEYGRVYNWGPKVLPTLYNEKTHFIYELLQNAEDACERARKRGAKDQFITNFHLFKDRLEVRHNGIPFNILDVKGICGIAEGTKREDLSQIGKFGIGFKSVYAFTKSPEIYSGVWSFRTKDYVYPYPLPKRDDVVDGETLFVIPFNHHEISKEDSFSRIRKRLQQLDCRNLLFLSHVREIKWKVLDDEGNYLRESCVISEHIRKVKLFKTREKKQEWLVFERPTCINNRDTKVEIAYRVLDSQIVPFDGAKLSAFFLTDKDTYLKFLIQGQYKTTQARDNIHLDDETNKKLLEETAVLINESISNIKEMNLLNVNFLKTLPIEPNYVSDENRIFSIMYNSVKEKLLSDEDLLPMHGGGHISARKALIVRGKDLLDLLSSSQLNLLFNKNDLKWLDENITENKTPLLRDYLMKELNIIEVDPEKFAREFNEDFIKQQADDWVKRFYSFLLDKNELWRKREYFGQSEGVLRSKPIIRMNDNKHIKPFDNHGKPQAYLAGRSETRFNTVKKSLVADEKAKKFLEDLGLREPDVVDDIINNVLSKYAEADSNISPEENKEDVKYIFEKLETCSSERKIKLLIELQESPFLLAINAGDSRKEYKKPTEISIRIKGTEAYFNGNEDIWFFDGNYFFLIPDIFSDIIGLILGFQQIGCKLHIKYEYKEPNHQGHIIISDSHSNHRRGLDGFDPECYIEGLEYALENINIERAKVIWTIPLNRLHKSIYGFVEFSRHQEYRESRKEEQFSKMGRLLAESAWLPDPEKEGNFLKPSQIRLSSLPDGFDKDSVEAKYVAKKLNFIPDVEQELLTQLPEGTRKVYEFAIRHCQNLSPDDVEKKLGLMEKNLGLKPEEKSGDSSDDIRDKFKDSLESEQSNGDGADKDNAWKGMDPDEEEKIRNEYGAGLLDTLKNKVLKHNIKLTKKSEVSGGIDPKEFLYDQYKGYCQICNTLLDLGAGRKPWFDVYRIVETRNKNVWSNMEFNVLCLCPNCHAIMKHGGKDLKTVFENANKVLKNEIAPEEVYERKGDFYIIDISVAKEQKQIFYSPTHMAKLAAFISQASKKTDD